MLAWPLVLGDAHSFEPGDLVATELVYGERTGEIYRIDYNPAQRWLYFPAMESDEAVVLNATIPQPTVGRGFPPMRASTTPPPRRMRRPAKASSCALSRSSTPDPVSAWAQDR